MITSLPGGTVHRAHRAQRSDVEASLRAKRESASATSAAVPTTVGVDTIGALLRRGSSCTLAEALVHGAIRPSSVTLGAPMRVTQSVQAICDAADAHAPMLRKASRSTLPQFAGTAMATLRTCTKGRCDHRI